MVWSSRCVLLDKRRLTEKAALYGIMQSPQADLLDVFWFCLMNSLSRGGAKPLKVIYQQTWSCFPSLGKHILLNVTMVINIWFLILSCFQSLLIKSFHCCKVVLDVCVQLVRQSFMCERIMACMYNLDASVVKLFLIYLKLFKLNLILFTTFFKWVLSQ